MPIPSMIRRGALLLLLPLLSGLSGCQFQRKTLVSAPEARPACTEEWAGASAQPHIVWRRITVDPKGLPAGYVLPASYEAYSASSEELAGLFQYLQGRGRDQLPGIIILPLPGGCQAFTAWKSGAIPNTDNSSNPKRIALQGRGVSNRGADLRLEWDGEKMQAQITAGPEVFWINPVSYFKGRLYLFYKPSKTGSVPMPFEITAPVTAPDNR